MKNYRQILNVKKVELHAAELQVKADTQAYIAAMDSETNATQAQTILQNVAKNVQEEAHKNIVAVVSECLSAIFDDPYEFAVKFEQKRGKTEATLASVRNGVEFTNPVKEVGGGVIDVAAFALRLSCLILQRPVKRRALILDEPFTQIRGKENKQRMRKLLLTLAENFNVQFILNIDVDSYPEFALGKVIELSRS